MFSRKIFRVIFSLIILSAAQGAWSADSQLREDELAKVYVYQAKNGETLSDSDDHKISGEIVSFIDENSGVVDSEEIIAALEVHLATHGFEVTISQRKLLRVPCDDAPKTQSPIGAANSQCRNYVRLLSDFVFVGGAVFFATTACQSAINGDFSSTVTNVQALAGLSFCWMATKHKCIMRPILHGGGVLIIGLAYYNNLIRLVNSHLANPNCCCEQ